MPEILKNKYVAWPVLVTLVIFLWWIDLISGYELNFFAFYFMPVALSGWYLGLGPAMGMCVMCGFAWGTADYYSGHHYSSPLFIIWNTMIRLTSYMIMGWMMVRIRHLVDVEKEKTLALIRSMSEVKILEGLLPICAQCKKIRDKSGQWQQIESYITDNTQAQFSHGYCPECARVMMENIRNHPTR